MKRIFLPLATCIILCSSCSSDDDPTTAVPDIIGTYTIESARDECPNSANNAMVDNAGIGICIAGTCTQITQVFNVDGTYTYLQIDEIDTGSIINTQRTEESGNYSISGMTLTTTSTDGLVTNQTIVNDGTFIDWVAAITDSGCDRIFRFSR